MTLRRNRYNVLVTCLLFAMAAAASAQAPPAPDPMQPMQPVPIQPTAAPTTPTAATDAAATQPAAGTLIKARVLEVRGDARHAPIDSEDFTPCKVNDEYPPDTVIMTGLRSSVLLRIGEDDSYTAVVIDPASKTLLSELAVVEDTKRVRIGVGYGQVRAGVVEGGLKSDFTVSSPVATLSKRGTWGFGLFMQRPDTFEVFLLDQGLVEAFNLGTGQRRQVLPGQFVDSTMKRWAQLANKNINVPTTDILGQSDIDVAYNRLKNDGLRILNPEGGQTVLINLQNPAAGNNFARLVRNSLGTTGVGPAPLNPLRPEGFFGTGRGEQLIPIVIGKSSDLAQRGWAQPGTYRFPRAALEGWLAQHGH